jgi:cellulase/cellobiase CelA1
LFATALPASAADSTAVFSRNTEANDYTAMYTITNGSGSAWSGWTVEFDLPGGYVGAYWDALMVRTGDHYRFANREYNGRVAPGGTTSFGFNAGGGVPTTSTWIRRTRRTPTTWNRPSWTGATTP